MSDDEPQRCPGYECGPGRTWIEAHKDEPAGRELVLPPGHFWYEEGGYIAHECPRCGSTEHGRCYPAPVEYS